MFYIIIVVVLVVHPNNLRKRSQQSSLTQWCGMHAGSGEFQNPAWPFKTPPASGSTTTTSTQRSSCSSSRQSAKIKEVHKQHKAYCRGVRTHTAHKTKTPQNLAQFEHEHERSLQT
jgi:hypothetical protein